MSKVIAMDVDEVCANLHDAWLLRYNQLSGDMLLPENIKSWEIEKYVKAGWTDAIFSILKYPHLYQTVTPMPYARQAVNDLKGAGFRVVYVSSCIPGTEAEKRDWLVRWGFLGERNKMKDFVAMTDKSLIAADFLFDDRVDNLTHFTGVPVLVDRPHNRDVTWLGQRVTDLRDALGVIRRNL